MARILIKGGSIVTMDPAIKDLPRGDILIENGKIAAVRPTIAADGAEVIDASQMIVLPGFINAHVHTWQSALRGVAADWTVAKYMQSMHRGLAGHFRPATLMFWAHTSAMRLPLAATIRGDASPCGCTSPVSGVTTDGSDQVFPPSREIVTHRFLLIATMAPSARVKKWVALPHSAASSRSAASPVHAPGSCHLIRSFGSSNRP